MYSLLAQVDVGAEVIASYSSVSGDLTIGSITYYLFWLACVCMGAATLFFFLERNNVPAKYRTVLTVSGLITAIACFHYYRMAGIYAGGGFPTEYRYIDWIVTTPLMLIKFPLLLGMANKGKSLLIQLVTLDVIMIATAYIAEVSSVGSGTWWSFFLIACLAELAIVALLYTNMNTAIATAPAPIAKSVRIMRLFILVGWAIYPVGFLMALTGTTGGDLREIFYNVADVINKVGFGLVAYYGVKALAEVDRSNKTPGQTADAAVAV